MERSELVILLKEAKKTAPSVEEQRGMRALHECQMRDYLTGGKIPDQRFRDYGHVYVDDLSDLKRLLLMLKIRRKERERMLKHEAAHGRVAKKNGIEVFYGVSLVRTSKREVAFDAAFAASSVLIPEGKTIREYRDIFADICLAPDRPSDSDYKLLPARSIFKMILKDLRNETIVSITNFANRIPQVF